MSKVYLHIEAPDNFNPIDPFANTQFKVTGNGNSIDAAWLMAAATQAIASRDGAPASELYDVTGSILKFYEGTSKSVTVDTGAIKKEETT